MLRLRNKWFIEWFYRATILNEIFFLVCGIIVRLTISESSQGSGSFWVVEWGFCGKTHRRIFWKTSTPWCMRCGYGCLVSNRRNSELLLASQTKSNYKHNSLRLRCVYYTVFWLYSQCLFFFLPVLLSCIIIIITLNNKTTPFQSEPNL